MGYNLKNARNENSISKIPKWQSLRSLALKSKLLRQFELLVAEEQGLALQQLFPYKSFFNQTVIKSHFFNARGFKLSHFDVFDMLFSFLAFVKL